MSTPAEAAFYPKEFDFGCLAWRSFDELAVSSQS